MVICHLHVRKLLQGLNAKQKLGFFRQPLDLLQKVYFFKEACLWKIH